MPKDTFAGQYWDQFHKGARARTELAQEQFTEYSAFTGSDIKAFILPQGDQLARNEIVRRLNNLEQAFLDKPDDRLDLADIQGELIATEQERVTTKAGVADPRDYIPLINLQSITISTFRSKTQVRALGQVNVRGLARGSRCLPASEKVLIRNKGLINIDQVKTGDFIQSSSQAFDKVIGVYHQGIKFCYKLKLSDGYELIASYDHPVLTNIGWIPVSKLSIKKHLVQVVSSTPSHDTDYKISDDILKLIALLIGDGATHSYKKKNSSSYSHRISLSIADKETNSIGNEAAEILQRLDIPFVDSRHKNHKCIERKINICTTGFGQIGWQSRKYNQLHQALLKFNLYNRYSHTKIVPEEFIEGLSTRQIKIFLKYLFATDGCYCIKHNKNKNLPRVNYTSTSKDLVNSIRLLLSKLKIGSRLSCEQKVGKVGGRPEIISRYDAYNLNISNGLDVLKFITNVGIFGKDHLVENKIELLRSSIKYNDCFLDISVQDFIQLVYDTAERQNIINVKKFKPSPNLCSKNRKGITPSYAMNLAKNLNDLQFTKTVNLLIDKLINSSNDMKLMKINSIQPYLSLPVYDLEVEGRHQFVSNFIVLHNTVAGTFILTEFNKDTFWNVLRAPYRDLNIGDSGPILPDQMRPFDVLLLFAHEMGNIAIRHIYGLEIVTNGVVYSIQDYYNENTLSYLAHDVSPLIPLGPAYVNDVFSDLSGSKIKLGRLIDSIRGTTLDTEFEYLKSARNPFR